MQSAGYTPAGGTRILLHDPANGWWLQGVDGDGVPKLIQQSVQTPNRDGATYVRTLLDQRFLLVRVTMNGSDWAGYRIKRRQLVAAMNPKLGLGLFDYSDDSGTTYTIPAVLEDGIGFDAPLNPTTHPLTLNLRCPDPALRVSPQNSQSLTTPGAGLATPISVPVTLTPSLQTGTFANAGDLDSYPLLTITAGALGCSAPVITNTTTGKRSYWPSLTLTAGQVLSIDMDARTATVGGVNAMSYRSADSESWPLATGNNTVTFDVATGSATLTVAWWTRLLGI